MKILLKLSGEIFSSRNAILEIVKHIKKNKQIVGIVVGGGNIFRGKQHGQGLTPVVAHQAGMIATMINGLVLCDLLKQEDVAAEILSGIYCPQVGKPISLELDQNKCLIFVAGTGNPFFTTDTNAILRALQIGADEVWKLTNVDGVYDSDPKINPNAKFLKSVTFNEAIKMELGIMDMTALVMAKENNIKIRVFNKWENIGSIIQG